MLKLKMNYKGNRNYLQGGDFFDAISSKLSSDFSKGSIKKLCFKSFARKQCFLMVNERPSQEAHQVGNGIWRDDKGDEIRFWIVEGKEEVVSRYPFDEEKLIAPSHVSEGTITLDVYNEHSAIENIVALTKKLNNTLTPEINGKWVFGQIDLIKPLPPIFNQIKIIRTNERKGMFSCNQVVIDKELVGEIRFIVGQP